MLSIQLIGGLKINKKLAVIFVVIIVLSLFVVIQLRLPNWGFSSNIIDTGIAYVSSGASQSVSNGVAHFIVPSPEAGNYSYSYLQKSGFTSTANGTIVATGDFYFSDVPNGYKQGDNAIFFFYVVDSVGGQNSGNIAVGVDGSGVWSLWIGGYPIYNYVFQTVGPYPADATWHHIVLTVDNSARAVTLQANGIVVINVEQNQFTDKTHPISFWIGIGEDWWCNGPELLEVYVGNVKLEIS